MPRLDTLSEVSRKSLTFFPCMEFEDTPWVPLSKVLSKSKVALVSTAGLHLRNDKPFIRDDQGGDPSFRVIPSNANGADILQSHTSIGFDHTAFYRDINIAFPIDRMRELANFCPPAGSFETRLSSSSMSACVGTVVVITVSSIG